MIQFNLLPDVKIEYLKTQRTKRVVMLISLILAAVSLTILTILFLSVQGVQKRKLDGVTKDIEKERSSLSGVEDLNKILTIQNQLNSLTGLHDTKPISSRIFGYIAQVTPANTGAPVPTTISKLDVDFATSVISIAGSTDSLASINRYADSIKFATYKSSTTDAGKPFSNVVTTLSRDTTKSSFLLTFNFDPILFSSVESPVLVVPKITSNRSETEKPTTIFKAEPVPVKQEGN